MQRRGRRLDLQRRRMQNGQHIVWKGLTVAKGSRTPVADLRGDAAERRRPEPDLRQHGGRPPSTRAKTDTGGNFELLPGRKLRPDDRSRTHAEHRQNQGSGDGDHRRNSAGTRNGPPRSTSSATTRECRRRSARPSTTRSKRRSGRQRGSSARRRSPTRSAPRLALVTGHGQRQSQSLASRPNLPTARLHRR